MLRLGLPLSVLGFVCLVVAAATPRSAYAGAESGFGVNSGGGLAAEDEAFKTELFSGASTASVPFIVPPGPNGFQPSLGLRYNAQAGNGWVGRGWLLEVPRVERMTKFGTPSYSDDPNAGDHFALSDDRLVRDDAGFYHAPRENSARIERVDVAGVIDHWIVRATNGETRWFGSTADSRIANGLGKKLSWLLSRAEDANGNFINYSYYTTATTNDDGQPYLKQITYSFQGDTLGSTTIRSIDFDLEDRPDPSISYRAGVRQEMHKRLGAVRVNYAGALVTRYELVYADEESMAPASRASLLRRVGRYGSNGTSLLPSDTFAYSSTAQPTWVLDSALSTRLAQLTVGVGSSLEHFSLSSGNWLVSDLNGDGAPDLLATKGGYESAYINDKTATLFPAQDFPLTNLFDPDTPVTNQAVRYVDYDGDGFTDSLFAIDIPGFGRTNYVLRSVTYDWTPETRAYATPPVPMTAACGYTSVFDVNGDGLPDLLYGDTCGGTTRNIYLNTGTGWGPALDATWSASFGYALNVLGANVTELIAFDWNGDGLLDLAKDANHDGVLDAAIVMINAGTGWLQDPDLTVISGLRPADLNGDGLTDHAGANSQLSGGIALGGTTFSLPGPFSTPGNDKRFIDIDGDGLVDLVRGDGATSEVYRNTTSTAGNLLTHIDRATGATIDITYQPTTAGSCYDVSLTDFDFDRNGCHAGLLFVPLSSGTPADCSFPLLYYGIVAGYLTCVMPYETLPFAVQTVESVTVDDATGTGNVRTDRVRFTGGRFDPTEREFRGFGRVLERPHYYEYTSPKGGLVKLGAIRVTQFYQLQFLRGEIAAVDLWSSADDDLDVATDVLVERT
ncbi:MAG: FG-GAP-like repeat-containing protein, partial [Proteobacteria bacterium]|nr:FG-GAP-like repeat-containing protein [Pseudomonadota bacterium]